MTRAVVWNLAKVMMIKDEVYVAMMYTSPEKYKRDRRRFNVNPANGDKIRYLHLNRPEFMVGNFKVRFHLKGRDWQMRRPAPLPLAAQAAAAVARPREGFPRVVHATGGHLRTARAVAVRPVAGHPRGPEAVTGYREVRYPKMEAARKKVAELQHALASGNGEGRFRPARTVSLTGQVIGTFRSND